MLSIDQINALSPEELAALNKKLLKRIVLTKIVAPLAITAVVAGAVHLWEKKHPISDED